MFRGLNYILLPMTNNVIIGVIIGAIKVDTAVNETDNATSPPARNVRTSEAVPPGTAPTKIIPTAKPASKENKLTRTNVKTGMIMYCAESPVMISFGCLNTSTKFSTFKVVPIVKITILKSKFNTFTPEYSLKTHLNEFG